MKKGNAVFVSILLVWLGGVLGGISVSSEEYQWMMYLSFIPLYIGGNLSMEVIKFLDLQG